MFTKQAVGDLIFLKSQGLAPTKLDRSEELLQEKLTLHAKKFNKLSNALPIYQKIYLRLIDLASIRQNTLYLLLRKDKHGKNEWKELNSEVCVSLLQFHL